MSHIVSNDGQEWYEITDEQMTAILENENTNCWVDWSEGRGYMHVPTTTIREMMKAGLSWKGPTTLYGLPIGEE